MRVLRVLLGLLCAAWVFAAAADTLVQSPDGNDANGNPIFFKLP